MGWVILGLAAFVALLLARRAGVALPRRALAGGGLALLAVVLAFRVVAVVPPGRAAVQVVLGEVRERALPEGLHLKHPLASLEYLSVRRETIDFTPNRGDAPSVVAVSADRNAITVDASFPYRVAAAAAPALYRRVGDEAALRESLLLPAARSAVRAAVARYGWAEAAVERREDVANTMREEWERAVVANLVAAGLDEAAARGAVLLSPVLLRDARPDAKVLNAVSEKVAAEEDLKRGRVLTDIARQEAERRANEGLGVARLFAELPTGFSPEQIRLVLAALADKQRADALTKAVENGRVTVMVLPSSTPIAVSAPAP